MILALANMIGATIHSKSQLKILLYRPLLPNSKTLAAFSKVLLGLQL